MDFQLWSGGKARGLIKLHPKNIVDSVSRQKYINKTRAMTDVEPEVY